VACICPMGVELAAVEGMLDEIHESLPSSRDQNGYTLGRIGTHNIVVAIMPAIGNNRAASVPRGFIAANGNVEATSYSADGECSAASGPARRGR
jgi:hypothetical protein